jgi:hypothetical protein
MHVATYSQRLTRNVEKTKCSGNNIRYFCPAISPKWKSKQPWNKSHMQWRSQRHVEFFHGDKWNITARASIRADPYAKYRRTIWGFHGSDYEECRLLGYKNPVRTSQETRYLTATESSRLMLSKIWGFHGGDYEECRLLGYKNPVRT